MLGRGAVSASLETTVSDPSTTVMSARDGAM